ncbi:MAG: hypothetical protein WAN30_09810 [Acidimicrobiales bacterium]
MAQSPARLDQSRPRDLVQRAGDGQPLGALERLDQSDRLITEDLGGVGERRVTELTESIVQIAYTLTRVAATKGAERQGR